MIAMIQAESPAILREAVKRWASGDQTLAIGDVETNDWELRKPPAHYDYIVIAEMECCNKAFRFKEATDLPLSSLKCECGNYVVRYDKED